MVREPSRDLDQLPAVVAPAVRPAGIGAQVDVVADLGSKADQPVEQLLVAVTGDLADRGAERRGLCGWRERVDLVLGEHRRQPPVRARALVGVSAGVTPSFELVFGRWAGRPDLIACSPLRTQ